MTRVDQINILLGCIIIGIIILIGLFIVLINVLNRIGDQRAQFFKTFNHAPTENSLDTKNITIGIDTIKARVDNLIGLAEMLLQLNNIKTPQEPTLTDTIVEVVKKDEKLYIKPKE